MARLPKGLKPLDKGNAPKRARSAYFLFCDSVRASSEQDEEMAGKSMAVASKVLSARWKALLPEEKVPFEQQAAQLKVSF